MIGLSEYTTVALPTEEGQSNGKIHFSIQNDLFSI